MTYRIHEGDENACILIGNLKKSDMLGYEYIGVDGIN
jgi:hypothetical protein